MAIAKIEVFAAEFFYGYWADVFNSKDFVISSDLNKYEGELISSVTNNETFFWFSFLETVIQFSYRCFGLVTYIILRRTVKISIYSINSLLPLHLCRPSYALRLGEQIVVAGSLHPKNTR